MDILFDNDGLRMWMDGDSPIIFIKFSSIPKSKVEPEKLIKKCRNSLRTIADKFDNLYSIIDISECSDKGPVTLIKFCFSYFPQLLDENVKYLAFVNTSHTDSSSLESHLVNFHFVTDPQKKSGCFLDFFGALGKINSLRQQQISLN